MVSAKTFTQRIERAIQYPQRFRLHSPSAAPEQPRHTTNISSNAHQPIPAKPCRAFRFSRQSGSNGLSGKSSMKNAKPLMTLPNTKNNARALIPREVLWSSIY